MTLNGDPITFLELYDRCAELLTSRTEVRGRTRVTTYFVPGLEETEEEILAWQLFALRENERRGLHPWATGAQVRMHHRVLDGLPRE